MQIAHIASFEVLGNCQDLHTSLTCKHLCHITSIQGEAKEALLDYYAIALLLLTLDKNQWKQREGLCCQSQKSRNLEPLIEEQQKPQLVKRVEKRLAAIFGKRLLRKHLEENKKLD
ncbi:MAG: hypothetical protein K0S07_588 [Chlamydiales bacterium]|jgi:hypothetical protein|nr:hypothetical protein [Chlamydiales bacterium]